MRKEGEKGYVERKRGKMWGAHEIEIEMGGREKR